MARQKSYLEIDVLTAARQRLEHIYDTFDSVVVMFSGGKDSLACLYLAKELHEKRGLGPVNVAFRDEELIPEDVIDFVDSLRREPWVNMRWYAVPLKGDKFVLGTSVGYVQWDPRREHVREKPEWAITNEMLGQPKMKLWSQYDMDEEIAKPYRGKVAFITGVRAAESLIRFRSVVNKLNENYIAGTECPRVSLVKPIYDWQQDDVFKFFHDFNVPYCGIYDAQHLAGSNLRVSTPLHSEASKRIGLLRAMYPDFYQRILRVFPEMELQDRYWSEYKGKGANYAETWEGCLQYIQENFSGRTRQDAMKRLHEFKAMAQKQPDEYYPAFLLKKLQSGTVKRVIMGDYTKRVKT